MTNTLFTPAAINDAYSTSYDYYPAGSIKSLTRRGLIHADENGPVYGQIDDLRYTYANERLSNVQDLTTDPQAQPKGFVPLASNYTYDSNGNVINDDGKALTIDYNLLNLPKSVSKSGGGNIRFDYTFNGEKIKKESTVDGVSELRRYFGGFEFVNDQAEFLSHAEGRILLSNGQSEYQYRLSDHLGNTVVLFADKDGDGLISTVIPANPEEAEVIQRNLYYPFGLAMQGSWKDKTTPREDYKYNGKELEEELGLNWYSYGFRMYDPAIGRFPSVDPIADQFNWASPFNYAENEPVGHIDLWGLQKELPEMFTQESLELSFSEGVDNGGTIKPEKRGPVLIGTIEILRGNGLEFFLIIVLYQKDNYYV